MICNACGSHLTVSQGIHRPYMDYSCEVFDCSSCGARFTQPEEGAHESLHAASGSSYGRLRRLTEEAGKAFADDDQTRMRALLIPDPKYRFVIEAVEGLPAGSRILEVGCAGGYLTAYLVLAGFDALGVDVSETAIHAAVETFGDRFALSGSKRMTDGAPYDAIVHVGTIGCVPDPVGLTRELLKLLSGGGLLAFNSPNVEACRTRPGPWGCTTQPPDLVTLFQPGFWTATFGTEFQVEEAAAVMDPYQRLVERRRARHPEQFTEPHGFLLGTEDSSGWPMPTVVRSVARLVAKGLAAVGALPELSAEYGLFVKMRTLSDR